MAQQQHQQMHSIPNPAVAQTHPNNATVSGSIGIQPPQQQPQQQAYMQQLPPVQIIQQHPNIQPHQQFIQPNMQQPPQQISMQHTTTMAQTVPSNMIPQQQQQVPAPVNTHFVNSTTIASQPATTHVLPEPATIYQVGL